MFCLLSRHEKSCATLKESNLTPHTSLFETARQEPGMLNLTLAFKSLVQLGFVSYFCFNTSWLWHSKQIPDRMCSLCRCKVASSTEISQYLSRPKTEIFPGLLFVCPSSWKTFFLSSVVLYYFQGYQYNSFFLYRT